MVIRVKKYLTYNYHIIFHIIPSSPNDLYVILIIHGQFMVIREKIKLKTTYMRWRQEQTTIFAEKGKIIVEMIGFLINICNFASEIEILLTK